MPAESQIISARIVDKNVLTSVDVCQRQVETRASDQANHLLWHFVDETFRSTLPSCILITQYSRHVSCKIRSTSLRHSQFSHFASDAIKIVMLVTNAMSKRRRRGGNIDGANFEDIRPVTCSARLRPRTPPKPRGCRSKTRGRMTKRRLLSELGPRILWQRTRWRMLVPLIRSDSRQRH